MAGDNRFVTEYFLAQNFTPKSGVTPGSDNTLWMDCDQILARYNVSISGVTTTGKRWPSQNQIAAELSTIAVYSITRTDGDVSCVWSSSHGILLKRGAVIATHPGAVVGEVVGSIPNTLDDCSGLNVSYLTGHTYWIGLLTPNTTYYARVAYETASGIYYGQEISFTTLP